MMSQCKEIWLSMLKSSINRKESWNSLKTNQTSAQTSWKGWSTSMKGQSICSNQLDWKKVWSSPWVFTCKIIPVIFKLKTKKLVTFLLKSQRILFWNPGVWDSSTVDLNRLYRGDHLPLKERWPPLRVPVVPFTIRDTVWTTQFLMDLILFIGINYK